MQNVFQVAFTDLQSEQDFDYLTVYGRSKSCNILFAVHLAKLLEGKFNWLAYLTTKSWLQYLLITRIYPFTSAIS